MLIRAAFLLLLFLPAVFLGCAGSSRSGNVGNVFSYPVPSDEALWIRDGEPIEFEEDLWYPADGTEGFLDAEVELLGEYRGVQFFVDKTDVKPYNRLYTKFARNKFRYFEKNKKQ